MDMEKINAIKIEINNLYNRRLFVYNQYVLHNYEDMDAEEYEECMGIYHLIVGFDNNSYIYSMNRINYVEADLFNSYRINWLFGGGGPMAFGYPP